MCAESSGDRGREASAAGAEAVAGAAAQLPAAGVQALHHQGFGEGQFACSHRVSQLSYAQQAYT